MSANTGPNDGNKGRAPKEDDSALVQLWRHHLVYSVFFSLAFTVLDIAFLWPENHFLALLALAATFSAVAWAEFPRVYVPQTVMGLFILMGTVRLMVGPVLPEETETHGWLMPAHDPSAETACPDKPWGIGANFEAPGKTITVALGQSGVTIPLMRGKAGDAKDEAFAAAMNKLKHPILTIGACQAIAATRDGDKISIDADVFDSDGHLTATIKNNEFHLVPAQMAYPDRPDRSTLIVMGREKEELFWIRYLNSQSVKIRGYFACKGVAPVHIAEKEVTFGMDSHISGNCMNSSPGARGMFIGANEFSE